MTGFVDRHFAKILIGLWALEVALLLFFAREAIAQWKVGDPDDQLRMVQVRDWLAGQSWSDVHQYRMNPPIGGEMHWSRLIDLPLGFVIASLQPFVGQARSELLAAIIIPMFTLGIFLYLYAQLLRKYISGAAAIASTAGLLTAVPVVLQLVPLRVDHHGWQLVCMVLCMTLLLNEVRPIRSAILLGIVSAVWLEISIEAFPFIIAFMGIAACRWLVGSEIPSKTPLLSKFNIFVVSTAVASAVLLLVMKPLSSLQQAPCDALSAAYVVGLFACALASTAILTFVRFKSWPAGFWIKLLVCGAAAFAGLAALAAGAPQCVGDSFDSLDPVVKQYWFNRTSEGLPLFDLSQDQVVIALVVFLLGSIGSLHLVKSHSSISIESKVALVLTFISTAVVGTFVSRTLVYFIVVTSIILAPLFATLSARIAGEKKLSSRLGMRTLAILLLLPVMTGQIIAKAIDNLQPTKTSIAAERFAMDLPAAKLCQAASSIKYLRRLPPSNLLVGLDVAPGVLQHSAHRVVASGHHRNQPAMRDVITAFTSTPDTLASVLKRRNIEFVAVCAAAPEFVFYKGMNPQGNWARLNSGERFDLLIERPALGPFRIWQVRK